jgi:hypothetical protein
LLVKIINYFFFPYIPSTSNIFKGSRLKPDAPEFIPNQLKPTTADPLKLNSKDAAKAQKKKDRDDRKAASLAKRAGKRAAKTLDNPDGMMTASVNMALSTDFRAVASTADELAPVGQMDGQMTEGEASGIDKPKLKRSRLSRRHLAKSEPGNRVIVSNDGQQDSDLTAVSSGEGQPLLSASITVRQSFSKPAFCAH